MGRTSCAKPPVATDRNGVNDGLPTCGYHRGDHISRLQATHAQGSDAKALRADNPVTTLFQHWSKTGIRWLGCTRPSRRYQTLVRRSQ